MATSRFANTSASEAAEIRKNLHAKNTTDANRKSAALFRAYLKEIGRPIDFETYSVAALNDTLKSFYMDARKTDGHYYKTSSMENHRHGLNRHLNTPPYERNIDIIKDERFREANASFSAMLALLKREGFGEVKHHLQVARVLMYNFKQSSKYSYTVYISHLKSFRT